MDNNEIINILDNRVQDFRAKKSGCWHTRRSVAICNSMHPYSEC